MNLTNEEKKKIADAVAYLMQAFCEFRMAEDRLNMMNGLVGMLLKMGINNEMNTAALSPYMERFQIAQKDFFDCLGIGKDNTDFWQYNAKVENERCLQKDTDEKNESNNPIPPVEPCKSCIEG